MFMHFKKDCDGYLEFLYNVVLKDGTVRKYYKCTKCKYKGY